MHNFFMLGRSHLQVDTEQWRALAVKETLEVEFETGAIELKTYSL
ncbi:hypothetical protein [Oculatella sp. FACHB-28]|nr:hypothetical protein [Oculatella sp. FACHB-28]